MILAVLLALLLGVAIGLVVEGRRTTSVLRTELNSARANEQLLLTRLASRTPAEFHAVLAASEAPAAPAVDNTRYLSDDTGLILIADEPGSAD